MVIYHVPIYAAKTGQQFVNTGCKETQIKYRENVDANQVMDRVLLFLVLVYVLLLFYFIRPFDQFDYILQGYFICIIY